MIKGHVTLDIIISSHVFTDLVLRWVCLVRFITSPRKSAKKFLSSVSNIIQTSDTRNIVSLVVCHRRHTINTLLGFYFDVR